MAVNHIIKPLDQQFFEACQAGEAEEVKQLLAHPIIHPNCEHNSYHQTPLSIACCNGRTEVVKVLLNDERVLVNKTNQRGQTPLMIARQCRQIRIVQHILASGREVNVNEIDSNAYMSARINPQRTDGGQWQNFQEQITGLLGSFERNPTETRTKLRNQLGLPDINFLDEQKRESRSVEEKKERKNQELIKPEYEIEYNHELFVLQTTVRTLPMFEIAIKSKLKLEQNEKIKLHFKRKGCDFVLDNFDSLQYGMRIKVSKISQFQPYPVNQVEHFQLKNWNEIVFLSQGANDEFRVEIDPDEIPPQLKNQIVQLMEKSSKLETCLRSRLTPSNVVFQIDFVSRNRADKVFEQIVDILESN